MQVKTKKYELIEDGAKVLFTIEIEQADDKYQTTRSLPSANYVKSEGKNKFSLVEDACNQTLTSLVAGFKEKIKAGAVHPVQPPKVETEKKK